LNTSVAEASATSDAVTPTPVTVVERGQLTEGFSLTVFAEVGYPTSLTFGPDGRLFVASSYYAAVYALADRDGDGRAEESVIFDRGLSIPLGLLWVEDELFVSHQGGVRAARDVDGDGIADSHRVVLADLPGGGSHQNDGLVQGPDGTIYLGMGSSCNACRETDWRRATILSFQPDGSGLSAYAYGLRNPYDLAFNAAGDLFATDNGRDDLGREAPPEELNLIEQGGDYGWPDCWLGADPASCIGKTDPVAAFAPRSSVNGLVFYAGENFPPEYQDNAFLTVLGSYTYVDVRRGVLRVNLSPGEAGYQAETTWFLELEGRGRPLDVTVGPKGELFVADYELGEIYRIVYGGS
jgi:putative membrane-bound dehydrogenase-like protein